MSDVGVPPTPPGNVLFGPERVNYIIGTPWCAVVLVGLRPQAWMFVGGEWCRVFYADSLGDCAGIFAAWAMHELARADAMRGERDDERLISQGWQRKYDDAEILLTPVQLAARAYADEGPSPGPGPLLDAGLKTIMGRDP